MAAMAPALTDAPAEAHHIRFRLAPPSSTLSPGSVENNSNASNILLLSGSGAVKRKALGDKAEPNLAENPPTHLGKLQPLVASYLCSDVTSVPSTKESLKLQGVLIKQTVLKTHGVLPDSYFNSGDFLPRKGPGPMSGGGGGGQPTAPPALNGLAKKPARPGADRDRTAAVNGDAPAPAGRAPQPQAPPLRGDPGILLKGEVEPQLPPPEEVSRGPADGRDHPVALATAFECGGLDAKCSALTPASSSSFSSPAVDAAPDRSPLPPGLDEEVRERTMLSQARQAEMEARLLRLRKRLQVVQAKQVERHVQQQLRGLLRTALRPAPHQQASAGFLRSGSVPADLDRLALSSGATLRAAESAFDSDATESSSGGESDAEEDELANADPEKRHVSLFRRAEGRLALDRASIISHWNWLQAHISDLEYRIRQQTDIYRQVRSNKGLIVLGDSAPCEVSLADGPEVKAEPIACHVTQERVAGGAESAEADSGLWKGWAPGRPVNGVLNSLLPSLPVPGSPESSDTEEQIGKKQLGLPPCPSASPAQDPSCVAARCRPILSCKKRRLVRPNAVAHFNRKRTPGPRCGCDVNASCLMCGGRTALTGDLRYDRPLLDRLSQSDPCVHPILSFDDDVSMMLHLQGALKTHWQNRPPEKSKPLKKLSLKHKLSGRLPDPSPSCSSSSKDKHKLSNSLIATVRLSHHKMRQDRLQHRQQLDSLLSASKLCKDRGRGLAPGPYDRGHSRKRPRDPSLDRTEPSSKLFPDNWSPCSSNSLHTPTHSPLLRQLSTSSESSAPFTLNSQSAISTPPIRRRRGESSFDINNIVIPMSVAATTRVEKLQYKEILTPSWREVNVCVRPMAQEDDAMEIEDLSDAAFSHLHQLCEDQERSRWSWTASAMAKRRGSRSYKSVDGRTTPLLGGTNPSTPQPSSPDTAHFLSLQDYGPMGSPCSPASPDLLPPHRPPPSEDTRCSTPDCSYEELPVLPWETRTFPLECDPETEPQNPGSLTPDWPGRAPRQLPVRKPESGPASPGPAPAPAPAPTPTTGDGWKQKGPMAP